MKSNIAALSRPSLIVHSRPTKQQRFHPCAGIRDRKSFVISPRSISFRCLIRVNLLSAFLHPCPSWYPTTFYCIGKHSVIRPACIDQSSGFEILIGRLGPGFPCVYTTSPSAALLTRRVCAVPVHVNACRVWHQLPKLSLLIVSLASQMRIRSTYKAYCLPHICLFTFTSQPHVHAAWDYKQEESELLACLYTLL